MKRILLRLPMAAITLGLAACVNLGPRVVGPAQFQYNQTVANSFNEQLLLNLVRLHYRDTPMFLKIDQIVAGYTFETEGRATLDIIPDDGGIDQATGSVTGSMTERPTVTMSPLQDSEFTSRLLSPIAPETLLLMAASGWQVERVMMCCVREVNGLRNLPATLDADLVAPGSFQQFCNVAKRLEGLQRSDGFRIRVAIGADGNSQLTTGGSGSRAVRSALGLPASDAVIPLTPANRQRNSGELDLAGRSLLDVMTFLSRYVEAPDSHLEQGLVVSCAQDTRPLAGDWLRIVSSKRKPSGAFISVRYRGHWFSVPDNALDAKETFGLLTQLFSLQASDSGGRSPLLTIPAG